MSEGLATWGSSRPDVATGLEGLYDHIPLGLVLPQVPEDLFLLGIVLADPLQAAFDPTLNVGRIEGQTQVKHLAVVAVAVADGGPAGDAFFLPAG